jgi:hypothetical protein
LPVIFQVEGEGLEYFQIGSCIFAWRLPQWLFHPKVVITGVCHHVLWNFNLLCHPTQLLHFAWFDNFTNNIVYYISLFIFFWLLLSYGNKLMLFRDSYYQFSSKNTSLSFRYVYQLVI